MASPRSTRGSVPPDDPEAPTLNQEAGTTIEVVRQDGHEQAFAKQFCLKVIAGPDAGVTHTSTSETVVIGTHPSAHLVLHDPTASRFHCDITLLQHSVLIRDLGSRNGTLVDGVPVVQAALRAGATLTLGRTQIRFDSEGRRVEIPLSEHEAFGFLVGRSVAMRAVFAVLERAAASDATVLILGETGTGKEAAAESIHRASSRREGPFVVVDCAAIPSELLESELFGHERGAFTGAVASRMGSFEAATGGTIFLDEIGELGPELQPKLLRALERREIKRVGTNAYVPIDVRVIAATNRHLRTEVNSGRFRSDLYYRLAVLEVRIPPLRDRPEDLPLLVEHILSALGAKDGPKMADLHSPDFIASIARHPWPGNVREVRNYLERCLALKHRAPLVSEPAEEVASAMAAPPSADEAQSSVPLRDGLATLERARILDALSRCAGNQTEAARMLGIPRRTFVKRLDCYGIPRPRKGK